MAGAVEEHVEGVLEWGVVAAAELVVVVAEAQGLRGSARQGKGTQGTQCGCPKGTAVAGANQAMGQ